MEGEKVILDTSVPVPEIARSPDVLLDVVRNVFPLDVIVGPSGYGLPVTPIRDITELELALMVPDARSIPLCGGIREAIRRMKKEGFLVYFTPGVIHLQTVPAYRKVNKLDMGTADKVCVTALAIRDQTELYNIGCTETSFILAEIGYAFNAIIAVSEGKIVDGLGGSAGGPGFLALGNMDSELAVRLGKFPAVVLYSGGAKAVSGHEDLTPEELAQHPERYADAWNVFLDSVAKGVVAMLVSVAEPREVLLSGRLSRIPEIARALEARLDRFGRVRHLGRKAKIAKEAAEGACIIGEGLLGGRYQSIVDSLELKSARGTMYDYVRLRGVKIERP